MNVLELMIKAVKGTVEEGVHQVLGGLGLVQETEQAPPATRPPCDNRPSACAHRVRPQGDELRSRRCCLPRFVLERRRFLRRGNGHRCRRRGWP
jgi:hypothetical protein